eukprot:scaffold127122_cov88-Phaeocystis_antarctica.AAC.1
MADVSGVLPYSVGPNSSDAPASISACTTSTFPLNMADLSGVLELASSASSDAPAFRSTSITSIFPQLMAALSGV